MDAMCMENVLDGTEGIYRNHLSRENVLDGTESWFLTMAWVYPLTPNPQQACHGISIRRSLGDKGFPTPDPELWEGCLKSQTFLCESPEFAGQENHLYLWLNFIGAC